jgi:hypothetical protein
LPLEKGPALVDDKTLNLVLMLMAGSTGLVLLLRLALLYKALRMYWGSPRSTTSNASHKGLVPPRAARSLIAGLKALGFHRLGETQVQTAGAKEPVTGWLFGSSEGVVFAELAGSLPLVGLTTMFHDGAVVQTLYPIGERISAPDYVCRVVPGSLKAAYKYHLRQVQTFGAGRGRPRLVEDMDHYLDVASVYRARHGQRLHRAFLERQFEALLFNLYGLAIPLGGMAVHRILDVPSDLIVIGVVALLFGLYFVKRDQFLSLPGQDAQG